MTGAFEAICAITWVAVTVSYGVYIIVQRVKRTINSIKENNKQNAGN